MEQKQAKKRLLPNLQIGDLVSRFPIIQGGMGVGISLGSLAGAVAAEGGIGVISAAQIGYCEEDFVKNPLQANLRAIGKQIQKARKKANGGVLGINIMVATKHYAQYVKQAVADGIDLIISGAGLPMDLPALTQNAKTKLVPILSSVRAVQVLCRRWGKKYRRIPDAIIMEGPKAGGHLAFSMEQLQTLDQWDYLQEVEKIITFVKQLEEQQGCKIPLILAGGIRTSDQVDACLAMGLQGVQVATPFVTTQECDADIRYKMAYIHCKQEDIVITKSPVGMPGRAIQNAFLEQIKRKRKQPKHCYACLEHCEPSTTPYCITEALIHAAKGELEEALLFCGADAYKETKIRTVKDVMLQLTE